MHQSTRFENEQIFENAKAGIMDAPPRVASADLLQGQRKLIIEHGEVTYVLVLTRNGKLILNK